MEKEYICKVASLEEMERKWDYEIAAHTEKENWIAWKAEAMEGLRSGRSIPYYGILDGTIICEATAVPFCETPREGWLEPGDRVTELCAFRTNLEYRGQGYFSKLKDYMLQDLKGRGYTKAVVGVEPEEEGNRDIYHHWGFTDPVCSSTETYPDGTVILVDFYGRDL